MKDVLSKIKEAKSASKKRKFVQTLDLIINLKGVDLKKPENRFSFDLILPNGRGKDIKTAFIADSLLPEAKKHSDIVITKNDIEKLAADRKKLKHLANSYDAFFGEVSLMPLIGRHFGAVLGPRGKMPKPVPPKAPVDALIQTAKKSVRVTLKETPVISVPIGTEQMKDEELAKNAETVFNAVKERLPKGQSNIKSVMLKLTMGKPVRVEF